MENSSIEQEPESSSTGIFKLSGEPAIVINGVPNVSASDSTPVLGNTVNDAEINRNTGFGDWLEGRGVQKLFGKQYFSGMVTEFDKESGWYRVVYEDGDFEDLDWHELEEVLLPLEITVPLRSLALKTIRKNKKLLHKSGKNGAQSRTRQVKHVGSKGKKIVVYEEPSLMKFNNS
jgi:hypothetical protein|uniref:PTM/DIR17-like Tudor domain-containing protein n=1 Tax=Fagus sylvatica TaxID=28930 RepID=A0A2N9FBU1_FAGSY